MGLEPIISFGNPFTGVLSSRTVRCGSASPLASNRYGESTRSRYAYGAKPPSDFGLWCLKQAVAMADTKPCVAEHLLELALAHTTDLELLQEHVQKNERLKTSLARLLSPRSIPQNYLKEDRRDRGYVEERRRQRLDHVRSNEAALRENRATPVMLYQMARKYFEFDFGNDGPKAIEKELRGDRSLTQAVLQGLRGAIDREDVPELEEILSLREKDRMHYLGWPFLAGLAEVERTAPEDASRWNAGRIRKAIAFYYCTPHG